MEINPHSDDLRPTNISYNLIMIIAKIIAIIWMDDL